MTKEEIKDKAWDFLNTHIGTMFSGTELFVEGYQQGATEQDPISRAVQQKIDIEKACEWLKDTIPSGLGQFSINDIVEELRKAMEE